ncbi:MAG: AAA family ATPase [Candidatus Gracilibacteria bacterium]
MNSILITGIAGSGKSSVSRELNKLGCKAYDLEGLEGMFKMIRKDTREDFKDYNNADMEKVKNGEWICDKNKLEELLNRQKENVVFYCGIASNHDELAPLFSKVFLLKASPDTIRKRLSNREGTDDMGGTAESREWVLNWKDWWETKQIERGVVVVEADGTSIEVAHKIIDLLKSYT